MASYLDQIPKQLVARRKAFAAAASNPALLPSCWAIVRTIANNIYDYQRNAVIGGCTFPDRPIYLSMDDAAFLNFGTTPALLLQDAGRAAAEKEGIQTPEGEMPQMSEQIREAVEKKLASLGALLGHDQTSTRVYTLESWLQDMYRDRLDVDFAEDLQRQIDALNAYMDSVPKALAALGLTGKILQGVVNGFNLFKTIIGSSHQLDREKMSFTDRRTYVNTVQKIELVMTKADQTLGAHAAGRSAVRELFEIWKDTNYEMMALTRQLRALWAGTSLDDRIGELAAMLGSVQKAMNRASEEQDSPTPQLPALRGDDMAQPCPTRAEVVDLFRAVTRYDVVLGAANTALSCREVRRYGPLVVVITPGSGLPRYCREIRKVFVVDEDDPKRKQQKTTPKERETDVDRRVRYPMNCLVLPVGTPPDQLEHRLCDAWLEYTQTAFAMQYKEFQEAARTAAPTLFAPPEGKAAKDLPPTYQRQSLARLLAAFVRWTRCGQQPTEEEMPGFEAFRLMALGRLDKNAFQIPARYRPLVELFGEAGAKRRLEMWKRSLGPRFALDRQLVAVNVLRKEWKALRDSLKYLPLSVTKGNSSLDNGFAKALDKSDQFAEHKAIALFRKFLTEQPDLKPNLVSVESQVSIEVETLRTQSESLGRVFQYDQAAQAMLQRQASQIQEKRNAANAHIDQYLTGLMYAMDGNYEAAEGALSMCLVPPDKRTADDAEHVPPVPERATQEWFEQALKPLDGTFAKRKVPGEDSPGTVCYDFVYYNLGLVYMRMKRWIEARMSFGGVISQSNPNTQYLLRQWAQELMDEATAKMSES